MLEQQADDRAVAVGEAAGKTGEPINQAARPLLRLTLTRSGAGTLRRLAGVVSCARSVHLR
jgi:hypothetical protein